MKRTLKFLSLVAVMGLILVAAESASAGHSWGSYHWGRTSNPFTLKLGDNVTSQWDSYLATTSSDWSASSVLDTTIVAGGTTARRCRPTSGRVEVCNAAYGPNGWLGVAQIWVSGSHIVQGTVKVNDTYFNTATYNTPEWRNLVMCQEVGHTLGLDHQDENFNNPNLGTCMDYTSDPSTNQHPNQNDFYELECIYAIQAVSNTHCISPGHTDSTPTVGASTTSKGNTNLDNPSEWGQIVRSAGNGRSVLYERDFGGGNKVFTFVVWAD